MFFDFFVKLSCEALLSKEKKKQKTRRNFQKFKRFFKKTSSYKVKGRGSIRLPFIKRAMAQKEELF
jgi:hypothetical protein